MRTDEFGETVLRLPHAERQRRVAPRIGIGHFDVLPHRPGVQDQPRRRAVAACVQKSMRRQQMEVLLFQRGSQGLRGVPSEKAFHVDFACVKCCF